MIHTVKDFGIVNIQVCGVFFCFVLFCFVFELSCFLDDPVDVGNLISCSSDFSKTIWKFTIHLLPKPGLENFKHYLLVCKMHVTVL